MRNILFKMTSILMVIFLLTGALSSTASAQMSEPDYTYSEEEVELLAKSLELMFDTGQVTENGQLLGYNRDAFVEGLSGLEGAEEIIQTFDQNNLFKDANLQPSFSTQAVGCALYGMKEKSAYINAENACINKGIKEAYGIIAIGSTIANLIGDKEFTLAAKKLIALGVRSNILGVIFTLSAVLLNCGKEMDKQFPGKSNCY
ncbi:hypothetical protein [Jeotgalibacillus sp. R-1-5s-1]|uniref:hypothetical protein n=1 Tax=Jeotgalibacillus sp. R-1-5s-1 TaxID=2555897 RepID=UPI00106C4DE5|nr:hypothetical protein [Jeotgalibacillus sp. R-1-5s-1]TFD94326.1 hypothetical protein E2491_12835 [Jeotgalibacillus sp. R-1-5s-1]